MDKIGIKTICFIAYLLPSILALEVSDLVEKTMLELTSVASKELQNLHENPQLRDSFLSNLTTFAEKELCFETTIRKSSVNLSNPKHDVESLLVRCYSPQRIRMIKEGLTHVTYRLNFLEGKDGQIVRFTRYGQDIFPPMQISTKADIKEISDIQAASITIEVAIFALNVVGVKVKVSDSEISGIAEKVVAMFENDYDEFMGIINRIKDAPDSTGKAVAIFDLLKLLYKKGIFWTIVKDICAHMTWYEWAKSAAEISLTLVAAFATDGLALIAKLVLALDSGYQFATKFASMAYLSTFSTYLN